MRLRCDHASLPKAGEVANGDGVLVRVQDDVTLLAVIDALGHGPVAAEVTVAALDCLRSAPLEAGALGLIQAVHDRLRGTRGAAAAVCLFRRGLLAGCSVGNVELRSSGRVPVVLTPGVLGASMHRLRLFEGALPVGERVVIFTDGISARLALDETRELGPPAACQAILQRHRRAHDDATVLVADVEE